MSAQWLIWDKDITGSFNARARSSPEDADARVQAYHSLDSQGVPLVRSAFPPHIPEEPEVNWEVKDYVDIEIPPRLLAEPWLTSCHSDFAIKSDKLIALFN